jgi:two-component system phosphate regulon sensor histidine kinase PhoR
MISRLPRSMLGRLGLAVIVAEILVVLIVGWYALLRVRELHREQVFVDLDHEIPLLVELIDEHWQQHGGTGIDDAVDRYARLLGIRLTLIREDGTVIADSSADHAAMDNHANRPEVRAALERGSGLAERFSDTLAANLMYVARLMTLPDDERLILRTALPLRTQQADLTRVTRIVGTAGILLLALTALAIYIVSRRFTGQMRRLAESAARFAAGDLYHRIERPTAYELSLLADSLNNMARQLSDRIRQLQTQQREQQAILQSMSNGVIALDLDQRILNVNRTAEQMFHIDAAATRGRLLQEVIRQPGLHRFVAHALSEDTSSSAEFTMQGQQNLVIQAASETLAGADGEPKGLLIVLNDVTQMRRFESLRSDFAANVSHELRTPITNINGYVETLQDVGLDDKEQAARFLQIIKQNSARLAAIVDDVMALTRLQEPQTRETLERQRAKIVNIASAAVGQYQSIASGKRITVLNRVPEDLEVAVHPQLLEQAVGNLVSNAITYSPPNTTVTIRGSRNADHFAISVEDQGPGIPSDHLPRLFERFYRVDRARSRELGGTGLGLAIVKHIALVHGGRVEVESEVGKGSVFRLVLPME